VQVNPGKMMFQNSGGLKSFAFACQRTFRQQRAFSYGSPGIAVVDFKSSNVAALLDHAFSTTGFAVLVNHGICDKATSELRTQGKQWFHLPLEDKQLHNKNEGYGAGGYLHKEEANGQLLGNFGKPRDWNESLTLPGGLPRLKSDEVQDADLFLSGPKKDDANGDEPALGFEEVVDQYRTEIYGFAGPLNQLVGEILEAEALVESRITVHGAGIRLAYYPQQTEEPEPGQLRAGEHVDSGGITILVRDDSAPWGTQVQLQDGSWHDVPCVPGSLVLNVGALLSRWTNGRWKAAVHRVANDSAERLSIVSAAVVFKSDTVIEPLPSCVSADRPAQYEPVVAGEFLKERVRLHRPTYAEEKGMTEAEAAESLTEQIRAYQM
jgi:isopenicillin N synthase-like dioxygenase